MAAMDGGNIRTIVRRLGFFVVPLILPPELYLVRHTYVCRRISTWGAEVS